MLQRKSQDLITNRKQQITSYLFVTTHIFYIEIMDKLH